jgi:hypothetical protein
MPWVQAAAAAAVLEVVVAVALVLVIYVDKTVIACFIRIWSLVSHLLLDSLTSQRPKLLV